MLEVINKFDFKNLAEEVRPFLFDAEDSKKVGLFPEFIRQTRL